jgi:hypothetical protein
MQVINYVRRVQWLMKRINPASDFKVIKQYYAYYAWKVKPFPSLMYLTQATQIRRKIKYKHKLERTHMVSGWSRIEWHHTHYDIRHLVEIMSEMFVKNISFFFILQCSIWRVLPDSCSNIWPLPLITYGNNTAHTWKTLTETEAHISALLLSKTVIENNRK